MCDCFRKHYFTAYKEREVGIMSIVDDLTGEELRTRVIQQLLRGTARETRGREERE